MLVTAYPAAADHSNSAVEAQASGSYPAAAADHSNSAMEAQASGSYSAAADHSNSAMEAQASSSFPAAAAAGKQQIIATVLWKRRLVAAIQQLYKLLYKSCIEAKQNNVASKEQPSVCKTKSKPSIPEVKFDSKPLCLHSQSSLVLISDCISNG